jgi:hypothetical protein
MIMAVDVFNRSLTMDGEFQRHCDLGIKVNATYIIKTQPLINILQSNICI